MPFFADDVDHYFHAQGHDTEFCVNLDAALRHLRRYNIIRFTDISEHVRQQLGIDASLDLLQSKNGGRRGRSVVLDLQSQDGYTSRVAPATGGAMTRPVFRSCLRGVAKKKSMGAGKREGGGKPVKPSTPARALCGVEDPATMLALLEFDSSDDSWLSGAFIDYVFCIFAKRYRNVRYLPTMFAAHDLRNEVSFTHTYTHAYKM